MLKESSWSDLFSNLGGSIRNSPFMAENVPNLIFYSPYKSRALTTLPQENPELLLPGAPPSHHSSKFLLLTLGFPYSFPCKRHHQLHSHGVLKWKHLKAHNLLWLMFPFLPPTFVIENNRTLLSLRTPRPSPLLKVQPLLPTNPPGNIASSPCRSFLFQRR